jgi:hypothetical protein
MATKPRSVFGTMTQSVPELGPRGTATTAEIEWGHSKRAECGSPERMREVSRTLLDCETTPPAWLKATATELARVLAAARMLEREADRWEAERLIDCT